VSSSEGKKSYFEMKSLSDGSGANEESEWYRMHYHTSRH